jgi:predicted metal-dependent HD superfamily phosphohydrolase
MNATTELDLREAWEHALADFHPTASVRNQAFADVAARYAGADRHYHTLDHIAAVLGTIHSLGVNLVDRPALVFAAFLHDVVYDTHASDNEEQSAAHSRSLLQTLGVPELVIEETARLILLTKTHRTEPVDRDGQVLLDADLAVLGADTPAYDRYAALIRQEYAWVPQEQWRTGRTRVLESFLNRPRLYGTETMFARAEEQARANLRRELVSLR